MRRTDQDHVLGLYLLKTEPDSYAWDDLERDGSTVWNGVRNNTALKHIRDVRKGDLAFLYHTGKERRIVGTVRVTSDAYPDPEAESAVLFVFDVEPAERLERPVSLAEIKDDPDFAEWDLVRLPRLSVMPVPPELWEKVLVISGSGPGG